MASPHIAGLAAYFLSIYPHSLNLAELGIQEEEDDLISSSGLAYDLGQYLSWNSVSSRGQIAFGKFREAVGFGRPHPTGFKSMSTKTLKKAMIKLSTSGVLTVSKPSLVHLDRMLTFYWPTATTKWDLQLPRLQQCDRLLSCDALPVLLVTSSPARISGCFCITSWSRYERESGVARFPVVLFLLYFWSVPCCSYTVPTCPPEMILFKHAIPSKDSTVVSMRWLSCMLCLEPPSKCPCPVWVACHYARLRLRAKSRRTGKHAVELEKALPRAV